MQTFIDYCYDTLTRKVDTIEKRPQSPSPFSTTAIEYDCCNLCCLSQTQSLKTWKHVKYSKKRVYFCSEYCWKEWMSNPSQMGVYSPPLLPQEQLDEIESFELQMTIESNAGSD